jgi:dTDP-glucose pyrophosphorylase
MSGLGKRFLTSDFSVPKPFIKVFEESMIRSVIKNLNFEGAYFIFIVNENQISARDFNLHIGTLLDNFTVITVKEVTDGPACSALLASNSILNNTPLIIANCDQMVHDFDYNKLKEFSEANNADGVMGCFISDSPKNSYVELDQTGKIVNVKEKVVISIIATNGIHYWKRGLDFVESAESMIEAQESYNNEFYIAPSYNYLVKKGKKILPFFYNIHYPIGTPEDLRKYQSTFSNGNS